MSNHIRLLLILQKYSVAQAIGFLKRRSVIQIFRDCLRVKRNFAGRRFWARGCCISTVGFRGKSDPGLYSESGAGREAANAIVGCLAIGCCSADAIWLL